MIRGLYTSALGMTTQMKKMDVVTNNIANADTRGFKRDRIVTQAFSEEMFKKLDDKKYEMLDHSQTIG
ncbi:MAG: flagellar biosynthesis protein FlgC, partial [Firmicutes bacterium]|nr:flagellar biosynthesis protein FlgC [Bacillota bacterium]